MISCRNKTIHTARIIEVRFFLLIFVILLFLTACKAAESTATPTTEGALTPSPVPTPTPIPLGQPGNPVIIAFVNENSGAPLKPEMSELASALSAQTGITLEARNYDTDEALIDAMKKNRVHMAWFHPTTYIYAQDEGFADVGLLSNHFGVYLYGFQILANIESGFIVYYDTATNQNADEAAVALQQLLGKRPCWIDPQSLSGFILPASLLKQNDISVLEGVQTQTHTAAVRALYIKGICDFAATFSLSGDPRTSPSILADLPDAINRIPILWRSDAIIPNLNLSFHSALPDDLRTSLTTAMIDIIQTDTGKSVVSAALNYDIQDLRIVDDSIYDPIRSALDTLQLKPESMLGR